jgi:hypothetical protein
VWDCKFNAELLFDGGEGRKADVLKSKEFAGSRAELLFDGGEGYKVVMLKSKEFAVSIAAWFDVGTRAIRRRASAS